MKQQPQVLLVTNMGRWILWAITNCLQVLNAGMKVRCWMRKRRFCVGCDVGGSACGSGHAIQDMVNGRGHGLIKQHLGPQLRQITAVQRICRVLVKVCEAQLIPWLPEKPSRDKVPDAEDISEGHEAALDHLNVRQVRLCSSHHIEIVIPRVQSDKS